MIAKTRHISAVLGKVIEVIAPPRCAACDAFIESDAWFCPPCDASLSPVLQPCPRCGCPEGDRLCPVCSAEKPPFAAAHAPWLYGGALADAIARLKYRGQVHLARPLGALLADALVAYLPHPGSDDQIGSDDQMVLVPVPLHRTQLAARGFNQAALIAQQALKWLKLRGNSHPPRLLPDALVRCRKTTPQVGKSRAQRQKNMAGAFRALPKRVIGRNILLVDDVKTTGATVTACTKALLSAGAHEVSILTLAHASL